MAICLWRDFALLSVSHQSRLTWQADLEEVVAAFCLATNTPLNEIYDLPVSTVQNFFKSQAFENWKKSRENEQKIQIAIVNRLNEVIKACGVVAKTVAKKP
jgi:hypothetical protein